MHKRFDQILFFWPFFECYWPKPFHSILVALILPGCHTIDGKQNLFGSCYCIQITFGMMLKHLGLMGVRYVSVA